MKILKLTILATSLLAQQVWALNLKISALNKTINAPSGYAEKVTVLKLDGSMQSVAEKTDTAMPVVFSGLPGMENAPYMVQITHKGVNYNKVIPPNTQGNTLDIAIDVYDTTNQFSSDIKLEKFIEIYYYPNVLATDITHHLTNTGRLTFTERGSRNGILVHIPSTGKNLEALATLESLHGNSDIKTIKLTPAPLPDKPGYYILEQAVKPGEKYYQVRAHYEYDGSPMEISFDNIYPMSTQPIIILHARNMKVQWKENPAWNTKPVFNENLGAETITMPNQQGKYTLVISGGTPEKAETGAAEKSNKAVEVTSPLNTYLKFGGLGAFVIILVMFFFYLNTRPIWLQVMQSKYRSRLEFELKHLQSLNLPVEVKTKKENALKNKMAAMDKMLK